MHFIMYGISKSYLSLTTGDFYFLVQYKPNQTKNRDCRTVIQMNGQFYELSHLLLLCSFQGILDDSYGVLAHGLVVKVLLGTWQSVLDVFWVVATGFLYIL